MVEHKGKEKWLSLKQGDLIFGCNTKQGFSFLIEVDDVINFDDSIEVSSKDFVTVRLSNADIKDTFFNIVGKLTLPDNYDELNFVPMDELSGRDDVYIISSKSEWGRTKEFAQGEEHFYMDYKGKQQAGFFVV